MIVTPKSVSAVLKLCDDDKTKTLADHYTKYEALCADNQIYCSHGDFYHAVEDFLAFGKTYRVTIEEVEDE